MALRTSFDVLSGVVERYETEGRSVRRVEAETDEAGQGTLHATVEVSAEFPASDGGSKQALAPKTAAVTDGNDVRVEFSSSLLADPDPSTEAAVSASVEAVCVTDDGQLFLTVALTIDPRDDRTSSAPPRAADGRPDGGVSTDDASATAISTKDEGASGDADHPDRTTDADHGESASESTGDELDAVRDESLAPYEDVEYLRRLYDSCETFAEMSRTIEMEVASETVRRYMIEAGVHTPASYDTESPEGEDDADTSPPVEGARSDVPTTTGRAPADPDESATAVAEEPLVADGGGLPDGVRIPDVVDAVVNSVTRYEVGRRLELDGRATRALLERLDLLEFVPRRLPAGPEQELSHEEVAGRIRQCVPGTRAASAAHLNG